jgi:hypothetical protein
LVRDLLAREDARKESIEKRGLSVITTSGALATLLLGLATFVTHNPDFTLPPAANTALKRALAAFAVASVLAVLTNLPLFYGEVDPKKLKRDLKPHWSDSQREAENQVAKTLLKITISARKVNGAKAWCLLLGILAEVVAVVFVAICVWQIL